MKTIFRATAILSSSSIISILVSLVSAKVMALYLQPEGYGYYGLLQSFITVASLLAGMGIATSIVRIGAAAVTRNDISTIATLRQATWLLFAALGLLALAAIVLFRVKLSMLVLGTPVRSRTIMLMGIALLFTVAANIQIGTLNAYHRVAALAKYGVTNTVLGAGVSIGAILVWRRQGIAAAVIAGSIVTWLVSRHFLRAEVGSLRVKGSMRDTLRSAWALLRFGGPYTASMVVGTGVQLALPMIVLHLLSAESVGYYRAAAAISVGYLGFLITAMGQDYYPRVSAAADQPGELVKLINAQHRLVMLVAVPMILATLALVPYAVPLIYSVKFQPAVEILEWQLIGDLFKFASWTMSFAILARCTSSVFFLVESIGGVVTLGTTWFAVKWFGLSGLGIGFVATYVIYYGVVWIVIRREVPLVWERKNKLMLLAGIVATTSIRVLPSTRFAEWRTPIALLIAASAVIPSVAIVYREFLAEGNLVHTGMDHREQAAETS